MVTSAGKTLATLPCDPRLHYTADATILDPMNGLKAALALASKRPKRPVRPSKPQARRALTAWKIRRLPAEEGWCLIPPRCATERTDDMEEVDEMVAAGEYDVARDELRFLLAECPDFFAAHQKLGEIALEENDFPLARGHFGYVHDTVLKVLGAEAAEGPLPYAIPDNQAAHESSKGLAWSLHHVGRDDLALEVVRRMLRWEPRDPLGVGAWLQQWTTGG
jgi:hypothetical protein